jgi:protein involved in polysaccharide export with SLBB domain
MMRSIILSGVVLLFSLANAQQNTTTSLDQRLPPDLQKQLLQKTGTKDLSTLDLEKLAKQKTQSKTETLVDTTALTDTLTAPPVDSLSTYEKIFRGDTLNPDSMLNTLSLFGHDFFTNAKPSTFAPTDNFSIPSDYIINTNDEILIYIWGRINEEHRLKVDRDGKITLPRIGPINVGGLPFTTMKENILNRINQIEGVNASVSVGTMRTIGVFIVGEVEVPGFYTISALSNITNALFAAGGPTKNGSLRKIQLKRNKKTVATIDFYDFLLEGKDATGLRLEPGDVIHVPIVKKMVAITGNVRRSAIYEISEDERLDDVIELSGGVTPSAWTNIIQIERFSDNKKILVDIDSTATNIPSLPVADGDIIKIFPVLDQNQNAVFLTGNVVRPGRYEFKEGMRLNDIIPDYNSLLRETYLEYAIIIRQDPPRFLNRIQTFNLKEAIDNPESENNIALQARDYIIIYKLEYFEPDRTIEIDGSVTNPGKYKLMENMKIRDLILQAGGLRDDASATRGELYRRKVNENLDQVATVKIDFCVECALKNDPEHNFTLTRLDRVFIRSKLGWEQERKVTLRGQFNYPGIYVLFEGETLGELIKRAGGFAEDAYLAAAVFSRLSVKEFEQKRNIDYNRQLETDMLNLSAELSSKQNPDEAQAILEQQLALKNGRRSMNATGRIVIDMKDSQNYNDFILEDGDELYIPRNQNTVSVIGEVYNPSTFKFDAASNTVTHYLEAAGGAKTSADVKHTYIIKANGNIVTNKRQRVQKYALSPGDAVVVPQKIRFSNPHKIFVDSVDAVFKISMLLGNLVTLILAINSLK